MQKRRFSQGLAISFLMLLLYSPDAYGQQRFSAGPRLGGNLSTYAGGNMAAKPIAGFAAGAFLMYSSLNHFGISADVLYSQKGARISPLRQRINYLEVPIALRYFLTRSGNFRPNLFAGPSLGFKLSATELNETTEVKRGMSNELNDIDLGIMGGFQLNFKGIGPRQRFLIDGRYTYGLPEAFTRTDVNRHNSVFTLTLGYGFGVGPEYRSTGRR